MVVIVVTAIASATLLTAAQGVRAQFERAIERSTAIAHGSQQFVVQALDSDAAERLASVDGLRPIWRFDAVASTGTRETSATARATLAGGPIVDEIRFGRISASPRETVISSALARSLSVELGDVVALTAEQGQLRSGVDEVTVVGIAVDPAARSALSLTVVVDEAPAGASTVWVSDQSPFEIEPVRELLDRRLAFARTVPLVAAERAGVETDRVFGPLQYVDRSVAGAATFLLSWLLLVAKWLRRRDLDNLAAMGMPWKRQAAFLLAAGLACLGLGSLVGGVFGALVIDRWGDRVARMLGQDWSQQDSNVLLASAGSAIRLTLTILVVTVIVTAILRLVASQQRPNMIISSPGIARAFRVGGWSAGVVAAGGCVWISVRGTQSNDAVGPTVMLLGSAILAVATLLHHLGPGASKVARRAAASNAPVIAAVGAVVFLGTFYSATTVHEAASEMKSYQTDQPAGSMLVNQVGPGTADLIAEKFRSLGGEEPDRWVLPVETARTLRAATPTAAECIKDREIKDFLSVPSECYTGRAVTPTNVIGLTTQVPEEAVVADVDLYRGGRIGLIDIDALTGVITSVDLAEADGVDDDLGGYLPGLSVHPDGKFAEAFNLEASKWTILDLPNFVSLSTDRQAEMRSFLRDIAGTAQISEDIVPAEIIEQLNAGRATAVSSFAGIGLMGSFFVVASATQRQPLMELLATIGIRRRHRWAFAWRVSAPLVLISPLSGSLAFVMAWQLVNGGGDMLGSAWLLPSFGGVSVGLVAFFANIRAARPTSGGSYS